MERIIYRLSENPNMKEEMALWFSSKWGIPKKEYDKSMEECVKHEKAYPEWYVIKDGDIIAGGMGVIENDFHQRTDLYPNICAVYTEPEYRNKGIAGILLNKICEDMKEAGLKNIYLVTDHDSFYERYGFEFYCFVTSDGEEESSRLYRRTL